MTSWKGPGEAPYLVLELTKGSAVIDGARYELAHKEFQVLVELAARPGKIVSNEDLMEALWPGVPGMTNNDVYTQVARLRRRIKDGKERARLIQNRRGFGYLIDLPKGNIEVLEGPSESAWRPENQDPEPTYLVPGPAPSEIEVEVAGPPSPEEETVPPDRRAAAVGRFNALAPSTALVGILVLFLLLGGSWAAGYRLSQRAAEPAPAKAPPAPSESTPTEDAASEPKDKKGKVAKGSRRGGHPGRATSTSSGGSGGAAGTTGASDTFSQSTRTETSSSTGSNGDKAKSGPGSASKPQTQPPPPPPQPDAQLHHLHNPDGGDHYMTASSATSNQKQASGYKLSLEGRVFTRQVDGTIAIALDNGTVYIYRSRDVVPRSVSVTELYRLSHGGDFFYTKSAGTANQWEAQGWARNVVGLVQ